MPGREPGLAIAVLGESTVAGIGARTHDEALTGLLARECARRSGRTVAWRAIGRDGVTARRTRLELLPALPARHHDAVVLVLGVNDVLSLTGAGSWARELNALIAAVRERAAPDHVLVAGVPPVHRFPALPQPLAGFLGLRSRLLDGIARETASAAGAVYAGVPMGGGREHFCPDGVHPSPAGYALWARTLAAALPMVA